ncbi:MAG: hydrolase [Actinoallomurus sp.]|nr:hydrolase [Actinoallomurus sp.]
MPEPVEAVLFDFSGTLMRAEPADRWVSAVLSEAGITLPDAEVRAWARRLEDAGGLPGGRSPMEVPDRFRDVWERRDLDPLAHQAAYTGLITHSGWPWPELTDVLYERSTRPQAWAPYPDTLPALSALAESGIRTAVISNIGWDPRPVLAAHGMARLFDAVVLSYEEGRCKPDPALFTAACARLDVHPRHTLMVGDNRRADGGAEAVGIRTFFVDPLPIEDRPEGFTPLLGEAGVGDAFGRGNGPPKLATEPLL